MQRLIKLLKVRKVQIFLVALSLLFLTTVSIAVILVYLNEDLGLDQAKASNQTFYIDCNNGSNANDGLSEATAWKDLDPVREREWDPGWQPGDQILFKTGCSWDTAYGWGAKTEDQGWIVKDSGASGSPITVSSYGTSSAPIFKNTYNSTYTSILNIQGDWIDVKNIKFENTRENGIFVSENSSDINIDNVEITNVAKGVNIKGTKTKLTNSNIHDLKMLINTNNGGGDDYGAIAIIIQNSDNEIAYNTIDHAIAYSYDFGVDGGFIEFYRSNANYDISRNFIHHNIVRDSEGAFEIGSTSSTDISIANNVVAYNLFENLESFGSIHLNDGYGNFNLSGFKLYNNTMFEKKADWVLADGRPTPYSYFRFTNASPTSSAFELKGNILYLDGIYALANNNFTNHSYNIYYMTNIPSGQAGLNITLGATEKNANPSFQSTTAGSYNFALKSTSVAIDSSTTTKNIINNATFSKDILGNAVPSGSAFDMGAYEFQQTPAPEPTPTCTSFTYSAWSECIDGTQTRSVLTSSPSGCTGGSSVTSQSCTPPDAGTGTGGGSTITTLPVYRFWSDKYKNHFYTISENEKNSVITKYPDNVWKYERIAYYAIPYKSTGCANGSSPLYRFWSDTYGGHFYTVSENEKNTVIEKYPDNIWRYERIAYCVYKTNETNTSPVFRFWSNALSTHFYTISENEKNSIIANYDPFVWNYERIAFYAFKKDQSN